jgi:basic membrane protein A
VKARLTVVVLLCLLASAPAADAAKPFRIGMVAGLGSEPNPYDVAGTTYEGFIRAADEPGVRGRVVDVPPSGDPTPAVSLLARQGYDVIVTPFLFGGIDAVYARRFPRTTFLAPDAGYRQRGTPRNVVVTVFRPQEAAYLAGYLAALMEQRRPGRHVVSAVGGVPEPQVDALLDGFRAGARAADPRVGVLTDYSHDFADPSKCAAVADEQITRGSGVVFDVAGSCGFGALTTAKRRGVWGVGVDADLSRLGPFILTSVLKNESVAMQVALRALRTNRFPRSGTLVFGYGNGGVALGRISPRVPPAVLRRLSRVRRALAAGRIAVP